MTRLFLGDCFKYMDQIKDSSVDMILCDLPYGTLNKSNPNAKWDRPLPMESLWPQWERVCKENAAIVLFGQGMFTADLMKSNPALWRYNLIWKKGNRPTGFLDANRKPLRLHEDIIVFYRRQPTYNPQFTYGAEAHSRGNAGNGIGKTAKNGCYGGFAVTPTKRTHEKYPVSVIDIPKEHPQQFHTTQKPVALLEWLIRTYTNAGETVLDNCMGSGSTGVAAANTGRNFIGIEINAPYFATATRRISEAMELTDAEQTRINLEGV